MDYAPSSNPNTCTAHKAVRSKGRDPQFLHFSENCDILEKGKYDAILKKPNCPN